VAIREAHAGDRYLLCSDGLSDVVSIETMAEALRIADPQECADRLVELALRSGGPDNVTVIVADVVNARPGEVIDDVPVRDGAFVDPAAAEASPHDSAAERAAAMARPVRAPSKPAEPARRRGRWKTPAIILGILVLIFGALGGTYAWAQTQYYVGPAGSEVAIYQGVNASFGPIKFSEVYRNTDLKMTDLNSAWRSQVESGITASSKSDAYRIVERLHHETLPLCSEISPSPTATPSTPSSTVPHTPSASESPVKPPSRSTSGSTVRSTSRSTAAPRSTAHAAPRPTTRTSAHASATKPRSAVRSTPKAGTRTETRVKKSLTAPASSATPPTTGTSTSITPSPSPTTACRGPR
jgi:protein phosphatase